jgi:hypothetical protein
MSECLHINLSFSGSAVLGKYFNDSTLLLHVSDYFPFEADLALYLKNLEFPSFKDNLLQV